MCTKYRLPSCFGFLLMAFFSLTQAAEPMLNGMAAQAELGKEQFIGALYSNLFSDNIDTLTTNAQSMRMELKITLPEGMTTRRFSRMWIEGMAINNPPALLTEQADSMVKFDGLVKGRLLQNDKITFTYEQNKGVNVLVNDVLLGNIPGDKFFAMLLRTWAGKVPPSTDYKNGILSAGKVNTELKNRFEKIKATTERTTEIATWSKVKSTVELVEDKVKKDASARSSKASPIEAVKQVAVAKSEMAKTDVTKTNVVKNEIAKNETIAKATPAKPTVQQTSAEDEDRPALTVATLLARQFYISDLMKKIRSNARYPKRSLERNEEGSIRINVILDRKGNVMSTSMIEASPHEFLNEAAQKLITKAIPLPPMPDSIAGSTFEFTAPITFTLPK
jgi:periplasmic protein TonB